MNLVFIAFMVEAFIGYPQFIYNAISHPVVWMGRLLSFLERNFNNPVRNFAWRRLMGVLVMLLLLAIVSLISLMIIHYTPAIIQVICIASLFAARSLYQHVHAVYEGLDEDNLPYARAQLAKIVGRDVENLDESNISKAAIESLAESFCDGVVAPVLFAACFGLVGISCYKMVSTADSMIGHKTERCRAFGWAAARLDDVFNYIPARISALLIAIASFPYMQNISRSLVCVWRDARKHASPNSGYPEAAMAGAVGVCLGGQRSYDGEIYHAPLIGENGRKNINVGDLHKALRIYVKACLLLLVILVIPVFNK